MEQWMTTKAVPLCRLCMEREESCAVSGDFVLPEYCPDIAVVLKCQVSPRILSRQWSGDRLLVDGLAEVRVLYLDEERRCLRETEFTQPISYSIDTQGADERAFTRLDLGVKYANCRAVSPRRVELRGDVTLRVCVEMNAVCDVAVPNAVEGLHTRCVDIPLSAMAAGGEKILAVNETIDFPADSPASELLLGGDCRAAVKECKLLAGKAIVKGEVYFHQLYTDEAVEGGVYSLDFAVPFSQILDVDDAVEGAPYSVCVTVLSDTQRCVEGPQGAGRAMEVSAKLLVQLQLYTADSLSAVLDAYHCAYPIQTDTGDLSMLAHLGCHFEQAVLPFSLELPAGSLEEIVDIWVIPHRPLGACENGTALLNGQLTVCMVVRDTDGMLSYYERTEDYRLEYPCSGNAVSATVTASDWRYRTAQGKLELQVSICLCMDISIKNRYTALCAISPDTDRPYPAEKFTLKLYYGEKGETLWDIARCCHTSPHCIAAENSVKGDGLTQNTLLLIPIA